MKTKMNEKTPLDLKVVSVFLFLSATSYFDVNTNINYFFGITVSGNTAKITWIISCLICILGAYGLWTRNLIVWRIIFAFTIIYAISFVLNFLLIPPNVRMKIIPTEDIPIDFEPSYGSLFFVFLLIVQLAFIFYLHKRRPLFN